MDGNCNDSDTNLAFRDGTSAVIWINLIVGLFIAFINKKSFLVVRTIDVM